MNSPQRNLREEAKPPDDRAQLIVFSEERASAKWLRWSIGLLLAGAWLNAIAILFG
jgi:hypothetical protein